jgi:hypothetical protein
MHFIQHAPDLDKVGIRIVQMGQFDINFGAEDQKKLEEANERFVMKVGDAQVDVQKEQILVGAAAAKAQQAQFAINQDIQRQQAMAQIAGSYQNYAAGQAMIGAGQGMAAHGVGSGGIAGMGAQMAVGVGVGNAMAGAFANPGAPPPATAVGAMVVCAKCNTKQPGGKFCAECGNTLAVMKKFCTGCGGELGAAAKFCANCGTAAGAQAAPGQ